MGDGIAQVELGRLYRDGAGGRQRDLAKAYQWFAIAANNLDGDLKASAVVARIQVASMLTPDQLSGARRAVS